MFQFKTAYRKLTLGASGRNFSLNMNIQDQDFTDNMCLIPNAENGVNFISDQFNLELEDEMESLDLCPELSGRVFITYFYL